MNYITVTKISLVFDSLVGFMIFIDLSANQVKGFTKNVDNTTYPKLSL